jgi:O-antigen ligase
VAKKRRDRPLGKQLPAQVASDPGAAVAAAALALVLVGTSLFIDSGADASFDAPKRLVALIGLAVAFAAAFAWTPRAAATAAAGPPASKAARAALWLFLAAVGWAFLAAAISARREASLDSWRALLLMAMALPLGASRVVGRRGGWLLAALLAACAFNAGVSLAQSRGSFSALQLLTVGPRDATGAFAGNVGYLALAVALAAVAALGVALFAASTPARVACAALLPLFAACLAVNRNLTALLAAGAGCALLCGARFRRRAWLPIGIALVAVSLTVVAYDPLRQRMRSIAVSVGAGNWDRSVTYRGGAWVAALEMVRERPLSGFGPGTFGAEFVPHRLAAEIRYGRRFVNPMVTSSYGETHCEYLQPFADAGIPGGLAILGAAGLLLYAAGRGVGQPGSTSRGERIVLLAILVAGAAAALTWFPLERPISAVPLLLAAGRAWRLAAEGDRVEPGDGAWRRIAGLAAAAVILAAAWPEIPRYAAERKVRAIQGALRFVLTNTAQVSDPKAALARISDLSLEAARALPGDPRPLVLAGGARFAAGEGDRAVELFRSALATGERAEIDLNLGRACEALGRMDQSRAWFVRGGWVSPPLLKTLLPDIASQIGAEVTRLAAELAAGRLKAPPPLP